MSDRNIARCLVCDDLVESKHRHDFRRCKCGNIFVDGGQDYGRYGVEQGWNTIDIGDKNNENKPKDSLT